MIPSIGSTGVVKWAQVIICYLTISIEILVSLLATTHTANNTENNQKSG